MKFRVYREISRIEYKDVEAENATEAGNHHIDFGKDFKTTDDGLIKRWWVDTDLTKEKTQIDLALDFAEEIHEEKVEEQNANN